MSLAGEERKRSIMTLLNEKGKVNVSELSQIFDVSTETIRRDLDELEKDNKLKKVYGGAVKFKVEVEPPHYEREFIHAEAKRVIGALAAELIEDNDVIIIDEGSTALQIIQFLESKRNLTILTSSIPSLISLIDHQKRGLYDGKIIFIGGEVNARHLRVSGPIAEKIMEDFYVNKSFLSVDGISLENGLTSYDLDRALFTRKLIRSSETAILLADSSKIAKRTVAKIMDLPDIHMIVSEEGPPSGWIPSLKEMQIRWISPVSE
ncbi:DeoR family transcriptional regulator [Paenibacillus baekrokdamisoli]|uniref:DeoR family transcriptional regulator n=1 Tax=Paenibacillus baekrokdamisoli TaxID=1712516 RepID=A0A3G9J1K4_9BACL|nr:DeoR/GlpR family DNA-binding transcription regulator [Paenibacillus baekrokdamisoli]MBB3070805.1 DeoR/GlpR family transcriptional regulator of sugar metabolism [Paenibacillus baekrokdamisoli]BBH22255.1 DeoR family transcriptional regulator [Paenibacillus baekrokdamisoli]